MASGEGAGGCGQACGRRLALRAELGAAGPHTLASSVQAFEGCRVGWLAACVRVRAWLMRAVVQPLSCCHTIGYGSSLARRIDNHRCIDGSNARAGRARLSLARRAPAAHRPPTPHAPHAARTAQCALSWGFLSESVTRPTLEGGSIKRPGLIYMEHPLRNSGNAGRGCQQHCPVVAQPGQEAVRLRCEAWSTPSGLRRRGAAGRIAAARPSRAPAR